MPSKGSDPCFYGLLARNRTVKLTQREMLCTKTRNTREPTISKGDLTPHHDTQATFNVKHENAKKHILRGV